MSCLSSRACRASPGFRTDCYSFLAIRVLLILNCLHLTLTLLAVSMSPSAEARPCMLTLGPHTVQPSLPGRKLPAVLHRAVRDRPPPTHIHSHIRTRALTTELLVICRITAILVSRFLLDLQYANHKSVGIACSESSTHHDSGRGEGSGSVSLTFERFVGSMGTSIAPGDGDEHDIEDDS